MIIKRMVMLLLIILIIEVGGVCLLRHYDFFYRTVPIKKFDDLEYHYLYDPPQKLMQFAAKSTVGIMRNLSNFVNPKRPGCLKSEHVMDLYEHAKSGGGLTCNGISELFLHILRLQGHRARKLFVVKSIGDPFATHTLVEIFENGRWVIYDPTFNISFEKDGQLLGAVDIAKSLIDGTSTKIKPIFYGEIAYKTRFETYPIHWLAHFNNVLLFKHGNCSASFFIHNTFQLIGRYWYGPVLYYFSPTGKPNNYLELLNWIYFFFACIGPLLLVTLSFGLILRIGLNFFKKNKKN